MPSESNIEPPSTNKWSWFLLVGLGITSLVTYLLFDSIFGLIFPAIGHLKNLGNALTLSLTYVAIYLIWAPLNAQVRRLGPMFVKAALFLLIAVFILREAADYFRF
ncbi:MAG: hypothetical protein ACREO5_12570 [Candidatus Binatia bacterium]